MFNVINCSSINLLANAKQQWSGTTFLITAIPQLGGKKQIKKEGKMQKRSIKNKESNAVNNTHNEMAQHIFFLCSAISMFKST